MNHSDPHLFARVKLRRNDPAPHYAEILDEGMDWALAPGVRVYEIPEGVVGECKVSGLRLFVDGVPVTDYLRQHAPYREAWAAACKRVSRASASGNFAVTWETVPPPDGRYWLVRRTVDRSEVAAVTHSVLETIHELVPETAREILQHSDWDEMPALFDGLHLFLNAWERCAGALFLGPEGQRAIVLREGFDG